MAGTIQITFAMTVNQNGTQTTSTGNPPTITQATAAANVNTVSIPTSATELSFGGVSNSGYLYIKNTDTTNFVYISLNSSPSSGNSFAKLLPGEFCFVPTRQTAIYALADTSAVILETAMASL